MTHITESTAPQGFIDFAPVVDVARYGETPDILFVCEHASNRVPVALDRLGLNDEALQSHIAWDPGALEVADRTAQRLNATLVHGCVSRLVYDCNRPPEALSAIPEKSEAFDIPGNQQLSMAERAARAERVHAPFHATLAREIEVNASTLRLMVTLHSFTPVYCNAHRDVELGILHGRDDRFARTMMQHVPDQKSYDVRLNEPYSAQDGVAHTLDLHCAHSGLPNVMIEIRNDLIRSAQEQDQMAAYIAQWITETLGRSKPERGTQ